MWYGTAEVSNVTNFIPESFKYIASNLLVYHQLQCIFQVHFGGEALLK